MKNVILEFLNMKDLLASVVINEFFLKDNQTILLTLDESLADESLDAINKALKGHKDLNEAYKMISYHEYMIS